MMAGMFTPQNRDKEYNVYVDPEAALDAVGAVQGPLTRAALNWLAATAGPEGALPYTLPSSGDAPFANAPCPNR